MSNSKSFAEEGIMNITLHMLASICIHFNLGRCSNSTFELTKLISAVVTIAEPPSCFAVGEVYPIMGEVGFELATDIVICSNISCRIAKNKYNFVCVSSRLRDEAGTDN